MNELLIVLFALFLIVKIGKKLLKTDYDKCYDEMERRGISVFGMCGGVVGGDKYTDNISYQCVDCPYFVMRKEKWMIKFEKTEIDGLQPAIRGMRNPMNSWEMSDSGFCVNESQCETCVIGEEECLLRDKGKYYSEFDYAIGPNDFDLMRRLRNAGTDHRKFMRMITVYVDITAPLYWWKEFDTYKVGTVANSCSTMHKIHAKEFTLEDFSTDHLLGRALSHLSGTISELNYWRDVYTYACKMENPQPTAKDIWWQMIQLLPSCYNQKRTVMLNYEVLANMYNSRKNHKLDEWRELCKWVESLPYSELITGNFEEG